MNEEQAEDLPPQIEVANEKVAKSGNEGCMPVKKWMGGPITFWHTIALVLLVIFADFCLFEGAGGMGAACLLLAATTLFLLLHRPVIRLAHITLLILLALLIGMMIWRHWWLIHCVAWLGLFCFGREDFSSRMVYAGMPIIYCRGCPPVRLPRAGSSQCRQ